jgi:uncharacterized protein (DUF3084 family)
MDVFSEANTFVDSAIILISHMHSANGPVTHRVFMDRATMSNRCVTQGTKGRGRPTTRPAQCTMYDAAVRETRCRSPSLTSAAKSLVIPLRWRGLTAPI